MIPPSDLDLKYCFSIHALVLLRSHKHTRVYGTALGQQCKIKIMRRPTLLPPPLSPFSIKAIMDANAKRMHFRCCFRIEKEVHSQSQGDSKRDWNSSHIGTCYDNFFSELSALKSFKNVSLGTRDTLHTCIHSATAPPPRRGPCMHQFPFISPISQALMRIALMVAHARKKEGEERGKKVPTNQLFT